jgi:formate dehydrogenase subunit gamma
MTAHPDVSRGDAVHRGDPVTVDRYTVAARINHWITAISLVLLALSGLALFHPSLFFLTGLFGGGQMARILHPWIGVVMLVSFAGLFFRFWRLNLWDRSDSARLSRPGDVIAGKEEKLPEVGKYNAGQKLYFWLAPPPPLAARDRRRQDAAGRDRAGEEVARLTPARASPKAGTPRGPCGS